MRNKSKKVASLLPPGGSSPPSATTSRSEHPQNGRGDTPLHSPIFYRIGNDISYSIKKPLSTLLALALVFSLFASMPMTAGAADDPFRVTVDPDGATYMLNAAAVPLKATFKYEYGKPGFIDSIAPMKATWYWSYDNSNTSRTNKLGESTVAYVSDITHTTTHPPATDVVGVKYYFAVLTYAESMPVTSGPSKSEPREAVTKPARIEVIATDAQKWDITARKVDDKGAPLAGATIKIVTSDGTFVNELVTDKDGIATFTVSEGAFIVSESKAPTGYNGTDRIYNVRVIANGVFVIDPNNDYPDFPITFVNTPDTITLPNPDNPSNLGKPFTVKKTDENGAPLAGATIRVSGKTEGGTQRVHDVVTKNNGEAVFTTVENGTYTISEYAAPTGYNATDETYAIRVSGGGIFVGIIHTPYTTVTFVNKKIPALNKKDHFAYMQGYPEGDFRPDKNMTRAEAVVMFARLLSERMDESVDHRKDYYPDVDLKAWYANQVCYMCEKGVLADYSRDEKFRPNEPVTRAEFATLAAHFDDLTLSGANVFTDVADSHWAVKYINSSASKGWIKGYPDNTFRPENNITRAEVVTLVNRILERKADQGYINANINALPRKYSDLPAATSHWAYWDILEASTGHDYTKSGDDEKWTAFYQ